VSKKVTNVTKTSGVRTGSKLTNLKH